MENEFGPEYEKQALFASEVLRRHLSEVQISILEILYDKEPWVKAKLEKLAFSSEADRSAKLLDILETFYDRVEMVMNDWLSSDESVIRQDKKELILKHWKKTRSESLMAAVQQRLLGDYLLAKAYLNFSMPKLAEKDMEDSKNEDRLLKFYDSIFVLSEQLGSVSNNAAQTKFLAEVSDFINNYRQFKTKGLTSKKELIKHLQSLHQGISKGSAVNTASKHIKLGLSRLIDRLKVEK